MKKIYYIAALILLSMLSCGSGEKQQTTTSSDTEQLDPCIAIQPMSTPGQKFFTQFAKYKGKAYEGRIVAGGKEGDGFTGQKLVMHVAEWDERRICIPFHVGENRSRTWILTLEGERVQTQTRSSLS